MNLDRQLFAEARRSRVPLALTVGLGLLMGILIVVQARLLSGVIASVFQNGWGLPQAAPALCWLLLIFVLRALLAWGSEIAAKAAAQQVKGDLRQQVFAHLLALGPARMRAERSGELTTALVAGIESLDAYFSQYLPQLALAALVPLTILLAVFPIDALTGLVLLITAPLLPVFMTLIGEAAEALTRKQWTALSRLGAHFLDVVQGLAALKAMGQSQAQAGSIARASEGYRQATLGVLRVTFLSALVLELVGTLSTAVVAVEIGLRLLYGRLGYPEALFLLVLAPEFYLPLRTLGARFHAGMNGVSAARRIFQILANGPAPPRLQERGLEATALVRGEVGKTPAEIRFEKVHYTYPEEGEGGAEDAGRPALRGVSFALRRGEHVALVGPSGAGKSTVFQLLLRFIEPDAGRILLDGAPLGQVSAGEWRKLVAWVPQYPYLFNDTLAANIRLGRPEAGLAEIQQAAQQANLDAFICSLPQGYETHIGEQGTRLSGGQAQRLALARAFLKDAPILLLDEPAANLDPEQESLLLDSLDRLRQGRTVLTIAHRTLTAERADRVIAMENGQVIALGNGLAQ
jgi:thiol reductant ABC exporter CydD subunit